MNRPCLLLARAAFVLAMASACSAAPAAKPVVANVATLVSTQPDPVRVTVALGSSNVHACRVDGTGQLWCWGANEWGQVRPNVRTHVEPAQRPYPGLTKIARVALADDHACVIHQSGRVSCWGQNEGGQVGDGTTLSRFAPVLVRGVARADELYLEPGLSCAHERGGQWRCWGGFWSPDTDSRPNVRALRLLPNLEPEERKKPMPLTAVHAFSLSSYMSAVLRNDGRVLSWDWNGEPASVADLSDAIDVHASDSSACALRRTGTVVCWTGQSEGMRPDAVAGLGRVRSMHMESEKYCAVRDDDRKFCWTVDAPGAPIEAILTKSAGLAQPPLGKAQQGFRCTTTRDGSVSCRGSNLWGERGDGAAVTTPTPTEVSGLTDVVAVDIGHATAINDWSSLPRSTCALRTDGTVWCWGAQTTVSDRSGARVDRSLPTQVEGVSDAVELHVPCARRRDHSIVCWDATRWGRVTSGHVEPLPLHTVRGADAPLVQFAVGVLGACGRTADGRVFCWEPRDPKAKARKFKGLSQVVELAMGKDHNCARMRSGAVSCWGFNPAGQFGDGHTKSGYPPYKKGAPRVPTLTPVPALGIHDATALWAGGAQTCVRRRNDDAPWCFGNFVSPNRKTLSPHASLVAARVPSLAGFASLALGSPHQCVVDSSGGLRCQGWNDRGALGTNQLEATHHSPIGAGVTAVSVGSSNTCAVRAGRVLCWGANEDAELGLGQWRRDDGETTVRFRALP